MATIMPMHVSDSSAQTTVRINQSMMYAPNLIQKPAYCGGPEKTGPIGWPYGGGG